MIARSVRGCTPAPISGRLLKPPITTHSVERSREPARRVTDLSVQFTDHTTGELDHISPLSRASAADVDPEQATQPALTTTTPIDGRPAIGQIALGLRRFVRLQWAGVFDQSTFPEL